MLLSFFFSLSILVSSISMECSGPLKHADPVEGSKLVSFALFLRHGIRTPLGIYQYLNKTERGVWICDSDNSYAPRNHFSIFPNQSQPNDAKISRRYYNQLDTNLVEYPPNCQIGDLLIQGMDQLYRLGQFYQQYLIQELRFLPRLIHPELMELRSTYVERTFRSAESFMAGFYPPVQPNEEITILTGSDTRDFLTPNQEWCPELKKDLDKFLSSDEYKERYKKAQSNYQKIFDELHINFDESNWRTLSDYLSGLYCTDQPFPERITSLVTDDIFNQIIEDGGFYYYNFYSMTKGVAGAPLFRELLRAFDEQFDGKTENSKKRFYLYSSHDTTIVSILTAFGYTEKALPAWGSHLAVEVWENSKGKFIRFVYNGDPIPIGEQSETLMKYDAFKVKMSNLGIYKYCDPFYE